MRLQLSTGFFRASLFFAAEHVGFVTIGADLLFIRRDLCFVWLYFPRALVAGAAQPIDILPCEDFLRLNVVILIG